MKSARSAARKAAPAKRAGGRRPVEALEPRAREAAHLLKLLSSEQRLTILCRLSGGEMSVGELLNHVDLSQSALSQHLGKLRAAMALGELSGAEGAIKAIDALVGGMAKDEKPGPTNALVADDARLLRALYAGR